MKYNLDIFILIPINREQVKTEAYNFEKWKLFYDANTCTKPAMT